MTAHKPKEVMDLKENEVFIRKSETYGAEKLQVLSVLPKHCNKYRLVPYPNGGCLLCLVIARGKEVKQE